jgi:hypothetical protein
MYTHLSAKAGRASLYRKLARLIDDCVANPSCNPGKFIIAFILYHPLRSQCFATDMVYKIYLLLNMFMEESLLFGDRIGGVMVSVLTSITVGQFSSPGEVKTKTIFLTTTPSNASDHVCLVQVGPARYDTLSYPIKRHIRIQDSEFRMYLVSYSIFVADSCSC